MKRLIYLALCLSLFATGCSNKEDVVNTTSVTTSTQVLEAPVSNVEEKPLDTVKEHVEEVSTDIIKEPQENEIEEIKEVSVNITKEDIESKGIYLNKDKFIQMNAVLYNFRIDTILNQSTGDMYYNLGNAEFMYTNNTNYWINGNDSVKYTGKNVFESESSIGLKTNGDFAAELLDKFNIDDVTVDTNTIKLTGTYVDDSGTLPAIMKVDLDTYEFISLQISQDEQSYVEVSMTDKWVELPELDYAEVSEEEINSRVGEVILSATLGMISDTGELPE